MTSRTLALALGLVAAAAIALLTAPWSPWSLVPGEAVPVGAVDDAAPGVVDPVARVRHPDVLLISVDTLRRDHLSAYGYGRPTSPNLEVIAHNGTRFDAVMAPASWTLPSHATLLTGRHPSRHGLENDGATLPQEVSTLAEVLRRSGYHTLGVVAHVYVSSQFGLDRGFEVFDDSLIRGGATNPVATQVIDRFLQHYAKRPSDKPLFGFIHLFDPHWDYSPPDAFRERFVDASYDGPIDGTLHSLNPYIGTPRSLDERDLAHVISLYDAEIAYTDAELGHLFGQLAKLERLDSTVVILTADHGEEFQEHGTLGHGRTLYEEQLAVPLIISGPGVPIGEQRQDVVGLVDVAPTVLALAGIEARFEHDGRALFGTVPDPARVLLAESRRWGYPQRAMRRREHKLIHNARSNEWRYFDLNADAREQHALEADPSGGALAQALQLHAARADSGWHLDVRSLGGAMHVSGSIRAEGKLRHLRRYFAERISGSSAEFARFELSEDGSTLELDLRVQRHVGQLLFETQPADSRVHFDLRVQGDRDVALYAGAEKKGIVGPTVLQPGDSRLAVGPPEVTRSGVFVRARAAERGDAVELSEDAKRQLKALGYTD